MSIIDQTWERTAAEKGVTVDELKQSLRGKLMATVEQMAAERGITVEAMERQIHLSSMLFSLGPNCLTNDEAMALDTGAPVPEHQKEHVGYCRHCQAFIDATQRKD